MAKKEDIKVEQVDIETLIPYARNAKLHSETQVAAIAGSIREFGFCNPVLIDKAGGIIAGHGRVLAARKLELKQVPCIRLGHLTDNQNRAYIIADNRLAETGGGWLEEMLQTEIAEIDWSEIKGIGIDDFEFDTMAFAEIEPKDFQPGTQEDQGQLDQLAPKPVCCPKCGERFDAREQL